MEHRAGGGVLGCGVEHWAGGGVLGCGWSIGLEVDCEEGWGDGIGGAGERSLQSH